MFVWHRGRLAIGEYNRTRAGTKNRTEFHLVFNWISPYVCFSFWWTVFEGCFQGDSNRHCRSFLFSTSFRNSDSHATIHGGNTFTTRTSMSVIQTTTKIINYRSPGCDCNHCAQKCPQSGTPHSNKNVHSWFSSNYCLLWIHWGNISYPIVRCMSSFAVVVAVIVVVGVVIVCHIELIVFFLFIKRTQHNFCIQLENETTVTYFLHREFIYPNPQAPWYRYVLLLLRCCCRCCSYWLCSLPY